MGRESAGTITRSDAGENQKILKLTIWNDSKYGRPC